MSEVLSPGGASLVLHRVNDGYYVTGTDASLPYLVANYGDIAATMGGDVSKVMARTTGGSLVISGERFAFELPDTSTGRDVRELARRGVIGSSSIVFIAGPRPIGRPARPVRDARALAAALDSKEISASMVVDGSKYGVVFGNPMRALFEVRSRGGIDELPARAITEMPLSGVGAPTMRPLTVRDYNSRVLNAVTVTSFDRSNHVRVPVIPPVGREQAASYIPAGGVYPLADVDLKALMKARRVDKVGIQRRLPEDVRQDFGPDVLAAFERSCLNDVGRAMDAALLNGIPGAHEPHKGLIGNGTVTQVATLAALTFTELSAAMSRVETLGEATTLLVSGDVRRHLRETLTRDQREELPPIVHIHGATDGTAVVLDGTMVGVGVRQAPDIRLAENVPGDFEADLSGWPCPRGSPTPFLPTSPPCRLSRWPREMARAVLAMGNSYPAGYRTHRHWHGAALASAIYFRRPDRPSLLRMFGNVVRRPPPRRRRYLRIVRSIRRPRCLDR
ncbi:hypothetical protein [Amycolatopsis sp. cmx-11-32]|uniref:hypothetical protein n=1 Tax=Amycolatopsis sp. cmx-11-32 TaxID=2785796 RepID=UPI0039E3B382